MRSEATALLPALVVACLLCPWEAEGRFVPQGHCKLPSSYRRFHANDTIIGRPVTCNSDDKICFRYNLIFDPWRQWCEPVGGLCGVHVNRTEFEHGSGRLLGICNKFIDPCPGYRMAYDNRCYTEEVMDVICAPCAHITKHLLGGVECREIEATPIKVQQPEEDGRCLIPDLRFPVDRSRFFEIPPTAIQGFQSSQSTISLLVTPQLLQCEAKQADCFAKGKVWVSQFEGCHKILEAGPCPPEHVVAMDSRAVQQGRAEATCVHVRGGCPRGHTRMLFDGQCHDDRELKVGAPGNVTRDQYGQYVIIPYGWSVGFSPVKKASGSCEMQVLPNAGWGGTGVLLPLPTCGSDDRGACPLFEVETTPPKPEDERRPAKVI